MSRRKTNCCLMPTPVDEKEGELYQTLLKVHCDRKREAHRCRGKVTVTATTLTLQCPVCGDVRKTIQ